MKSIHRTLATVLIIICLLSISNLCLGQKETQPTETETRSALQNRIEQQAEGRMKLVSFKEKDRAMNGAMVWFSAQIECVEACKWPTNFLSKPVIFKTFRVNEEGSNTNASGSGNFAILQKGEVFELRGYELLTSTNHEWKPLVIYGVVKPPTPVSEELSETCANQIQQIRLAFRFWEAEHGDRFPCNVSTNAGGTMELCAPDSDGLDKNGFLQFRVLSNYLKSPQILICPADNSKKPASSFRLLEATNISYQIRSGTNIDDSHPEEILIVCPIHGHIMRVSGSLTLGVQK